MCNYMMGKGRLIYVPSTEDKVKTRGMVLPTNNNIRELVSELVNSKAGKFIAIQFEDGDDFSDLNKTRNTVSCIDFYNESKIEKYNKDNYIVIMKADENSIVKLGAITTRG